MSARKECANPQKVEREEVEGAERAKQRAAARVIETYSSR